MPRTRVKPGPGKKPKPDYQGMLNKRNVMEYIALIPEYEQVLSELAKLLVAARLGLPSVVDTDVKDAMEAFARVVYALKGLASLVE